MFDINTFPVLVDVYFRQGKLVRSSFLFFLIDINGYWHLNNEIFLDIDRNFLYDYLNLLDFILVQR
jgi:hypothetical protein